MNPYYYGLSLPERPLEPPPDRFFHYCARCGCEVYEDEDLCDECREEQEYRDPNIL